MEAAPRDFEFGFDAARLLLRRTLVERRRRRGSLPQEIDGVLDALKFHERRLYRGSESLKAAKSLRLPRNV